ncbi:MAG TPA: alkaline phosphatase family protein [Nitrososphaerales archaeon]|nr:alkaline phosphatase family protein [Nitrososphaerales archaeon]
MRKLIIIGLDAADYHLTSEFMKSGDMPRLSRIANQSCFSLLKSTIPPQTAPAWTTLTTGVNPGKHGIYYFYNFSNSPITITNATDTSTPRIWDYVQALNGRSVIVNVPVTYPVHEISGSMISGIPPWYLDKRSVYPLELQSKLRNSGYEIDTPMSKSLEKHPDVLVSRLIETMEARISSFLDLLKEENWSFGMVVLTALDRLQHKALGKGNSEKEAVRRGYREVDRLVGKVMDTIGEGINYFVVSDHGFNSRPTAFYPNAWLYKKGLLRRKSSLPFQLTRMAHYLFDGHFLWVPQGLTKRFQGAATSIRTIDAIDLERSRAFVPGTDGVVVVKSKEDKESIISDLSRLKDDSGKEICKVYTREEIYKGPMVDRAPELLVIPREDINIKTDPFSLNVLSNSGDFPKANHGPDGIFLATGPDIVSSKNLNLSLEDVAPTALALLGIGRPENVDGRIVQEIMSPKGPLLHNQSKRITSSETPFAFSKDEEKLIMNNLERIGYT